MLKITNGVDSVEVARIERSMKRPSFCRRIFAEEELEYFAAKGDPAQSAAGHFAAKEAFLKAMGTGITTVDLHHVAVLHDVLGAPHYRLTGWASALAGDCSLALSITHTSGIATAFAVAYRDQKQPLPNWRQIR